MTFYQFPGAYVWQRRHPNHEELKARVLPKIIEQTELHRGDISYRWDTESESTVTTNFTTERSHPWSIFTREDVAETAFNSVTEFVKSGFLANAEFPKSFSLKAWWWNRYTEGSTAPPHVHSGGISGVYILEQNERCPLEFMDINVHSPDHERPSTYFRPEVDEGTILLFPGTLLHWVRPTLGPRTTVSFNLNRTPD